MQIALSNIIIEDRQRKDFGDLAELVDSIKEFGLLQPIVVEHANGDKYKLVAGGRRLASVAVLGWPTVEASIQGELTPVQSARIELEENIRRKSLEWLEEVNAIKQIHSLLMSTEKEWTVDKTAAMIGKSRQTAYNALELSAAVEKHPELADSDTQFTATKKLGQLKDLHRRQQDVIARQIAQQFGMKPSITADARLDGLPTLAAESVDFILTDPPFGINYTDFCSGDRELFEDAPKDVVPIVRAAIHECYRVLKQDHWMLMFWTTNWPEYTNGRAMLNEAGFDVMKRPIVWYKPNRHGGGTEDRFRQLTSQYETILIARKGNPRFSTVPQGDVFAFDVPTIRFQPTQKPVDLLMALIEVFTIPGELVLDPFAGSYSTLVAAVQKERNSIGWEISEGYHMRGSLWLAETLGRLPTQPAIAPKVLFDDTGAFNA